MTRLRQAIRARLALRRRRRCLRRGHPIAADAPVLFSEKEPDRRLPDGTIVEGNVYEQRAYRCAEHG